MKTQKEETQEIDSAASAVESGELLGIDDLPDDHQLWCLNEQIKGLLEGWGATEDHESVLMFLRKTGLPEGTVSRVHRAIVCAEVSSPNV